jgi:Putative MetA-pathway of phenol degradation
MSSRIAAALVIGAALAVASSAYADDSTLGPICPDRPGKGTSPCTVDEGHFQIEIDAADGTFNRHDGVTTDSYTYFNPTLKYGLTDVWDIEASLAPFNSVRTHDSATDTTDTVSGIGDLYLRTKWNFLGTGDHAVSAIVEPFLKIPTAGHDIGNGAVEGGVVVPLSTDLGGGWSLAMTPEADALKNEDSDGRHLSLVNVIGIGRALDGGITLGAEIWGSWNDDPHKSVSQSSFDLDIAWQPPSDPNLQLDGGVNFGLNLNTPDSQLYVGISRRF